MCQENQVGGELEAFPDFKTTLNVIRRDQAVDGFHHHAGHGVVERKNADPGSMGEQGINDFGVRGAGKIIGG
jgi:hypothetical protein